MSNFFVSSDVLGVIQNNPHTVLHRANLIPVVSDAYCEKRTFQVIVFGQNYRKQFFQFFKKVQFKKSEVIIEYILNLKRSIKSLFFQTLP